AGTERIVERKIDRRKPCGIAAVAGAVGAQLLAIDEGVFTVGVTLAVHAIGAVDAGAEEDLGRARRTESLAHLGRRRAAAQQRKISSVAASHAEGWAGARHGGARRRPRLRVGAE